jgi:hypothetical protein
MKAYQVHKGDENKHGFQEYELDATYLSKEKALEHAQKLVASIPLHGDILEEHDWYGPNKQYKSWYAEGWGYVCICRIEEIDIIE